MAWNEPGNNGNQRDPWGGGGGKGGDQGPPDLDEVIRSLNKKLNGLFGKGGKGGSGNGGDAGASGGVLGLLFAAIFVIWFGMGIYQVNQQELAVVLRFGKYHDTVEPGLQWNPPLIDEVTKINVTRVRSSTHNGLMLTEDENMINVELSVQYTVSNPKDFLLAVRDPELSLHHATESALRHVVGSSVMHDVLTDGRENIAIEIQARLQNYLNDYSTGIQVAKVNVEETRPPREVQAAFDDVIKAREDEQRVKNEAEAYANGIVPEARGMAQRLIEEANAYKQSVIAQAQGQAARFEALLTEYKLAPEVTRERLYIEAIEAVMTNSSKVMVDVEGGNNMMYLPLDRIVGQSSGGGPTNRDFDSYQSNTNDNSSLPNSLRNNNNDSRRRESR
jgi:membrane protease subunit HflK